MKLMKYDRCITKNIFWVQLNMQRVSKIEDTNYVNRFETIFFLFKPLTRNLKTASQKIRTSILSCLKKKKINNH